MKTKELNDQMIGLVVERLKALADETRVKIILHLKNGPASVGALSESLSVAQPTVSKHLAILKNVGLVEVKRQGTTAYYSIKDHSIYELCSIVCSGVSKHVREQHEALDL